MRHTTTIHTRGDTYTFSEKELALLLSILHRAMEERPNGNTLRTLIENEVTAACGTFGTFNVFVAIHEIREALCGTGTFYVSGRHILVALALKKTAVIVSEDKYNSTVLGGEPMYQNAVAVVLNALYEILAYGSQIVIERTTVESSDAFGDDDCDPSMASPAETIEVSEASIATKKQLKLRDMVDTVNALMQEPSKDADEFIVQLFSDIVPVFKITEEHKKFVTIVLEHPKLDGFVLPIQRTRISVRSARTYMASVLLKFASLYVTQDDVSSVLAFGAVTETRRKYQEYIDKLDSNICKARYMLLRRGKHTD